MTPLHRVDPMNDDLHLLTGAYAVDALDADERRRFERHLAACPDCQLEVAGFRDATASLAMAVAEPAPASLRAAVLDEVDRTRQVSPLRAPVAARRPTPRIAQLAVAAAVVLIAALGGLLVQSRSRISDLERTSELALAPDARSVLLGGDDSGQTLRLTWSTDLGRGVLVGADIAEPGTELDYQLWAVTDGSPRSLGVFDPSGGAVELDVEDLPEPGDLVAVTVEPDGGSTAPTTDPTLTATVT